MKPHPLTFTPIFLERVWGGCNLERLFGKRLPSEKRFGESWEIVDRPEAQSVVRAGLYRGRSLHDLWVNERDAIFGEISDTPRFPLLVKLLDCGEKLSLQVHPPADVALDLGGECKTEFWYVAHAANDAEIYAGFKERTSRDEFRLGLQNGRVAELIHGLPVKTGDSFFIPSGRVHAIGGGSVIVEIQQNSDTTYRVFDWDRRDEQGKARELHIDQAMRCIDFNDRAPQPVRPDGEILLRHHLFEVQKWELHQSREIAPPGSFAILCCLSGGLQCGGTEIRSGEFVLIPATLDERHVQPRADDTSLLRITIPR